MKKILLLLTISTLLLTGCDDNLSHEVTRKTINADKAIENYEWFKQQEQDIKAKYAQEERARKTLIAYKLELPVERDKWTREDRSELSRLQSIVDGIGHQVDQMSADYNARITMKHREVFKDNLPTNIVRGTDLLLEYKYDVDLYKQRGN